MDAVKAAEAVSGDIVSYCNVSILEQHSKQAICLSKLPLKWPREEIPALSRANIKKHRDRFLLRLAGQVRGAHVETGMRSGPWAEVRK
jgi:hypothetical protein